MIPYLKALLAATLGASLDFGIEMYVSGDFNWHSLLTAAAIAAVAYIKQSPLSKDDF